MGYQFLVDDLNGGIWEVPITKATWTTERVGTPSKLEAEYLLDAGLTIREGNQVQLLADGKPLFVGYVTDCKETEKDTATVTAYDQLWYLTFPQTYVFEDNTATQIFQQIASDQGITLGACEDTGTVLDLIADNQKLLDTVTEALNLTLERSGNLYMLWDDGGNARISMLPYDLMTDIVLGDESLATGYDYGRSISSDVYNRVTLIRKDEKTGKYDIVVANDDSKQYEWGTLNYGETIDEKVSTGDMEAYAQELLNVKSRVKRTLRLEAIGDFLCRAGASVYVDITRSGLMGWAMIDKATHTLDGNGDHTMKLDMFLIDEGGSGSYI